MTRGVELMREFFLDLLALVWPTECIVCGHPDRDLCAPCRREMACDTDHADVVLTPAGVNVFSAGPYAGASRALLLALKHEGMMRCAAPLGAKLVGPLRGAIAQCRGDPSPLIVTAPSRASKERSRGFRHVDVIVRAALRSARGGEPFVRTPKLAPRALVPKWGRVTQVGLDSARRAENAALVKVRRRALPRLRGREVILVDDIVTTGATVAASYRCLTESGVRVVAIVALCAVVRRDARSSDTFPRDFSEIQ